jgi:predicted acetyltransferase
VIELAPPSARFQRSFLEAEQELALEGVRDVVALAIDPALVTCDAMNLASRKTIERRGGVVTSASPREGHAATLRSWIPAQRYS